MTEQLDMNTLRDKIDHVMNYLSECGVTAISFTHRDTWKIKIVAID